ncbi:hypothetical protein M413DRAFT_64081 [Hebeloma cylindrosporum]|uniref:Protein kinase domain-containing protein n=1 Tax=Hebeloma cylindrosporum TaxID=76867 RepID=A0A0C3CTU5_HEBCY|nr:hypothetical protein M413DRAFT_64081 [Hebeloma cylindrosporum h7]
MHDLQTLLREAIHLRLMPHPHIVPCMGIVMSETMLRIISPWMENGDIVTYTKKHPSVSKKDLLEQVADGLHFLQQYKLVHGDLKGSNVLINDHGKACIADLGLSNLTSLSGMSNLSSAGTYRYMSPERIVPEKFGMDTPRATFSSDVFSFGMLVYEVYAGHPPFHGIRFEASAIPRIANGERPMRPRYIEDEVWSLATRCWNESPKERPHIFEVYNTLAVLP